MSSAISLGVFGSPGFRAPYVRRMALFDMRPNTYLFYVWIYRKRVFQAEDGNAQVGITWARRLCQVTSNLPD